MTSVLLINLLIAMFSNTFDRLQTDTDCIWKFQHYSLVCYHLTRPTLPPPLIIISHIWRSIVYLFARYSHIQWFHRKHVELKDKEKFSKVERSEWWLRVLCWFFRNRNGCESNAKHWSGWRCIGQWNLLLFLEDRSQTNELSNGFSRRTNVFLFNMFFRKKFFLLLLDIRLRKLF